MQPSFFRLQRAFLRQRPSPLVWNVARRITAKGSLLLARDNNNRQWAFARSFSDDTFSDDSDDSDDDSDDDDDAWQDTAQGIWGNETFSDDSDDDDARQDILEIRRVAKETIHWLKKNGEGVFFKNLQLTPLPDDELGRYAKATSKRVEKRKVQMEKRINKRRKDTETCRIFLLKTLNRNETITFPRGPTDRDCFYHVMMCCVMFDQVEQAHDILTILQSLPDIQPDSKCYAVVMNGYAKRKTPEALTTIEEILKTLEELRLQMDTLSSDRQPPLDCHVYNTLMNVYVETFGQESLPRVQQTMERMNDIAERLNDDSLRPDLMSHAIFLKILILQRQSGFANEINDFVDKIKAREQYANYALSDRMHLESVAITAWSESNCSEALQRAQQVFDAMEQPSTDAYNSLCKLYAANGDVFGVRRLYHTMVVDSESGTNDACRPDMITYRIVMKALLESNRSDSPDRAEPIFQSLPTQDAVASNLMLRLYAQHNRVDKAFDFFLQMHSDFQSGATEVGLPDVLAYNALFKVLRDSNRADAAEMTEQIFNTLASPNTFTCNVVLSIYGQHGHVDEVLRIVHCMERSQSPTCTEQSEFELNDIAPYTCRPDVVTYNTVLNALHISNRVFRVRAAEEIFHEKIESPTTISYTTLMKIYAHDSNNLDKILALLDDMQAKTAAGKTNCSPNMYTYSTVLHALHKSNRPTALATAEHIFQSIDEPNTTVYATMLHLYARHGRRDETIVLLRRMQRDYDANPNLKAKPNTVTRKMLLKAIRGSPPGKEDETDVVEWFGTTIIDPYKYVKKQ